MRGPLAIMIDRLVGDTPLRIRGYRIPRILIRADKGNGAARDLEANPVARQERVADIE